MGTRGGTANGVAGTHPMPMNMINSCSAGQGLGRDAHPELATYGTPISGTAGADD